MMLTTQTVSISMPVGMLAWTKVHVCTCWYVLVHLEARGQPQLPFLSPTTLVFETRSFTDRELIKYLRLTGQQPQAPA